MPLARMPYVLVERILRIVIMDQRRSTAGRSGGHRRGWGDRGRQGGGRRRRWCGRDGEMVFSVRSIAGVSVPSLPTLAEGRQKGRRDVLLQHPVPLFVSRRGDFVSRYQVHVVAERGCTSPSANPRRSTRSDAITIEPAGADHPSTIWSLAVVLAVSFWFDIVVKPLVTVILLFFLQITLA